MHVCMFFSCCIYLLLMLGKFYEIFLFILVLLFLFRFRYKDEYEKFKLILSGIGFVLSVVNLFTNYRWVLIYTCNKSRLKVMKTQIPAMSYCTYVRKRVYFAEHDVLGTILYVQVYVSIALSNTPWRFHQLKYRNLV